MNHGFKMGLQAGLDCRSLGVLVGALNAVSAAAMVAPTRDGRDLWRGLRAAATVRLAEQGLTTAERLMVLMPYGAAS